MKTKFFATFAITVFAIAAALADDITALDGTQYQNVRSISIKPKGLFFVVGDGTSVHGVTIAFTNLPADLKEKYHCDPFDLGLAEARQNQLINLNKNLAFSLDQLDAAKQKAQAEHKLIGFIMEWDSIFVPGRPMGGSGSNSALAHFYVAFKDSLVLVFVRHEDELNKVPDSVKKGFFGPDEGGFAPNMAVVTADCSQFVCEIPFAGKDFAGREQIFRDKIAVVKQFVADHGGTK